MSHLTIDYIVRDEAKVTFYKESINGNQNLFEDRIILDLTRSEGLYTLFALRAKAKKCITMVDRIDIDVVKNFINGNGYSDQVSVIGHFSEITSQVHIIMTDCSCNDILVGYRL